MYSDQTITTLPAGAVTFLFTDIEGSTRLWERDPAAMWRVIARHNVLLGQAIREHHGHHFKTIGDAYQAAFLTPLDAVSAAVSAQQAFSAEPWPDTGPIRVRMAIHMGTAEPSPSGDYLAPSLNRLARLMSAGHGGQVLLSAAVHDALAGRLPPEVTEISLGRHRLRDLLEAEEVWQLTFRGGPDTFPPLKSLEGFPTNLPRQPTEVIGRDDQIALLRAMLAEPHTRLLTLTGPGGIGKTRLALAVAAESLETFPDGVSFVPLAGIDDAALLVSEIAGTLGVREGGGFNLRQSLFAYLDGKHLLLVLDNLEQIRPFAEAAATIAELLQRASTLRILATSRAPLNVRAEREWPVPPLTTPEALPARPDDATVAALEENPAVALFLDRARAARPAWGLTSANAADVVEIARRLEGVPLAIELAAARIRVLAPKDIVKRLGGALDLLASRAGDRPDRQQTLRAAIAWSHDLLSFENQAAFRRLGVFAGGFTLDAAEKVLIAAPDPWIDALDAISILVEQSLLRAEEEPDGETRYRMLETIRAFALEDLAASREEPVLRRAHATWAEAFARHADVLFATAEGVEWLERSERELDNYRAAMTWAIAHDATCLGLRLPEAMWRLWRMRGLYAEGRTWISRALEASPDASPEMRALALEGLGNLAWKQGDLLVAAAAYEESLATWQAAGKLSRSGVALTSLGIITELRGDVPRAISLQEQAVAIARDVGDQARLAVALNNLGTVLQTAGEDERAMTMLEESIAIKRKMGNIAGLASSLTNLAILAVDAGNVDQAIGYLEETLVIDRQVGDPGGVADSLGNLAAVTSATGDVARAAALDAEALGIRYGLGDRLSMAYGLESIASTVARAGNAGAGARLFGAAEQLRQDLGAPLPASEHERYEKGLHVARAALSDEEFAREWETGKGLPLDYAVEEALYAARQVASTSVLVREGSGSQP